MDVNKERTVLITGGHKKIGLKTTKDLAKAGFKIVIASPKSLKIRRILKKVVEESGNRNVFHEELDLGEFKSIRKFADGFKNKYKYVDILINNSSINVNKEGKTKDGHEIHFGVNYLGHFLLTTLLLDIIKPSGKILNIVAYNESCHTRLQWSKDDPEALNVSREHYKSYYESESAKRIFTVHLANMLKGQQITALSLDPGYIPERKSWFDSLFACCDVRNDVGIRERNDTTTFCALNDSLFADSGSHFSECTKYEPDNLKTYAEMGTRLWNASMKLVTQKTG